MGLMPDDQPLAAARSSRIAILTDFGAKAVQTRSVDELLELAVEAVSRAMDVHHVKILEHQPATNDLLVRAGRGWREGIVGHVRIACDLATPAGGAFLTGQSVAIGDIREDPQMPEFEVLRSHGILSILNVPIRMGTFNYGALEIDGTHIAAWTPDDLHFLEGFASFIAACLQRLTAEAESAMLLRELQHRTNNTIAMISAIVQTHRRKSQSPEAQRVLSDVAQRVRSIGAAHSLLRGGDKRGEISLQSYVAQLCRGLQALIPADRAIKITTNVADRSVSLGTAIPLGLIINELALNAIKHAFDADSGEIVIELSLRNGDGTLIVADDGIGMKGSRPGGSGLALIHRFVEQLRGSYRIEPNQPRGTRSIVQFQRVA